MRLIFISAVLTLCGPYLIVALPVPPDHDVELGLDPPQAAVSKSQSGALPAASSPTNLRYPGISNNISRTIACGTVGTAMCAGGVIAGVLRPGSKTVVVPPSPSPPPPPPPPPKFSQTGSGGTDTSGASSAPATRTESPGTTLAGSVLKFDNSQIPSLYSAGLALASGGGTYFNGQANGAAKEVAEQQRAHLAQLEGNKKGLRVMEMQHYGRVEQMARSQGISMKEARDKYQLMLPEHEKSAHLRQPGSKAPLAWDSDPHLPGAPAARPKTKLETCLDIATCGLTRFWHNNKLKDAGADRPEAHDARVEEKKGELEDMRNTANQRLHDAGFDAVVGYPRKAGPIGGTRSVSPVTKEKALGPGLPNDARHRLGEGVYLSDVRRRTGDEVPGTLTRSPNIARQAPGSGPAASPHSPSTSVPGMTSAHSVPSPFSHTPTGDLPSRAPPPPSQSPLSRHSSGSTFGETDTTNSSQGAHPESPGALLLPRGSARSDALPSPSSPSRQLRRSQTAGAGSERPKETPPPSRRVSDQGVGRTESVARESRGAVSGKGLRLRHSLKGVRRRV